MEKEIPGQEEACELQGYLVLEIDGRKYEWKGTEPGSRCVEFGGLYIPGQEQITLSVSESAACSGRKEHMNLGIMLTAPNVGGVYKIKPNEYKGDRFQLDLQGERYSAAGWLYATDLEVVITGYNAGTGVIEGTFGGDVAKYLRVEEHEMYLKMVPIKGAFRVRVVTLTTAGYAKSCVRLRGELSDRKVA